MPDALPVVADVIRSGVVEGTHRGTVVALASDGRRLIELGDPDRPVFARSSLKPLQAVAMLRCGLDLGGESLALAAASHDGTPGQVDLARRVLAGAGLTEDALQCPADLPLDGPSAEAHLRAGGDRERVLMNCSGKHAAMLATCVTAGWDPSAYREPDSPLQQRIRATVEELTGTPVTAVAVDGCGAPLFALPLAGLANAFGRLVRAAPGSAERRVADAMRAHPEVVGGEARPVTTAMRAVPGLLAKDGAEGVYGAALTDGTAVALKIEDGAQRAAAPVLVAALRALGVVAPGLEAIETTPVLGAGEPVGAVVARPVPLLLAAGPVRPR